MLPDLTDGLGHTHHLAVGAGKDSNIYVVDRDVMGKFNPNANHLYQEIQGALSGSIFSMPAYFNNTVYYGAVGDNIKAFAISNAQLSSRRLRKRAMLLDTRCNPEHLRSEQAMQSCGPQRTVRGRSTCLRCDQSFARVVQQQSGSRWKRSIRHGE